MIKSAKKSAYKVFDNQNVKEKFDINIHKRIVTGIHECENDDWRVIVAHNNDGYLNNSLNYIDQEGSVFMLDRHYHGYTRFLTLLTNLGDSLQKVYMSGLGLGTMIPVILSYSNVKILNVVENNASLIDLIQPFYNKYIESGRLSISCADARSPGDDHGYYYDLAFHDIWTSDNKDERVHMLNTYMDRSKVQVCWNS
jgi:hypothetical protein